MGDFEDIISDDNDDNDSDPNDNGSLDLSSGLEINDLDRRSAQLLRSFSERTGTARQLGDGEIKIICQIFLEQSLSSREEAIRLESELSSSQELTTEEKEAIRKILWEYPEVSSELGSYIQYVCAKLTIATLRLIAENLMARKKF